MTKEQLDAIRARVEAGPARALLTQIEIDRDGTTRWVHIGPYLCFTHEDAAKVRDVVSFVHNAPSDLAALLAEVERLTAERDATKTDSRGLQKELREAKVRHKEALDLCERYMGHLHKAEAERDAAFQRGVTAMRAAAVAELLDKAHYLSDDWADDIRNLPDPEDTE